MLQADKFSRWRRDYTAKVEKSVNYYNYLNQLQPVHTRQMTEKERQEAFGEKPVSCHKLKISKGE